MVVNPSTKVQQATSRLKVPIFRDPLIPVLVGFLERRIDNSAAFTFLMAGTVRRQGTIQSIADS